MMTEDRNTTPGAEEPEETQRTQDSAAASAPSEEEATLASHEVGIDRVLKLLHEGKVRSSHGRIRWSSNYTSLVTVHDSELEALAVYKPRAGERPLWDFPDGTLCQREVAAYVVSETLSWGLVPPTVLRDGPSGIGSIQLFIEHDPEINYFALNDSFVPELKRLAAFDVIVNNADRKGGHCLVDPQQKLWGIDHGICFHSHHKLRTVIWDFAGQRIPADIISDIRDFCEILHEENTPLNNHLSSLLNPGEMIALKRRVQRLLEREIYPQPGPGPNYPWPPV